MCKVLNEKTKISLYVTVFILALLSLAFYTSNRTSYIRTDDNSEGLVGNSAFTAPNFFKISSSSLTLMTPTRDIYFDEGTASATADFSFDVGLNIFTASGSVDFYGEIRPDGSTCSNGQILKKTGANDWDCAADNGGSVASNSLGFGAFVDSLVLDANLTIASTSNNYTIDFLDTRVDIADTTFLSNGNVGIGTTGPSQMLHLNSGATSQALIQFNRNSDSTTKAYLGIDRGYSSFDANDDFLIQSQKNILIAAGGDTNSLYIKSNGNVGIGTTGPNVSGYGAGRVVTTIQGSTVQGVLELSTAQAEGDDVQLGDLAWAFPAAQNGDRNVATISVFSSGATANQRGANMRFYTKADTTNDPIERMRIDNQGNVGIGTSNITEKLELVGNASISGDISFFGEIKPDGSTCSNGQILKKTGANDWDCASDETGGGGGTPDFRDGFTGAFTNVGSISFNSAHFDTLFQQTNQASISIDWGAGGPASLSQAETITGNWVNTDNPWADNEVADTLTINGGTVTWTDLTSYPTGCTNQFVTTIGDTLTCATADDAYVNDAITISGGTIGSNNISGTLTTTGTLTIGDNGDSIIIDASNWDVSTLGKADFLSASVSTNFEAVGYVSASQYFGATLSDCDSNGSQLLWSDTGLFSCQTLADADIPDNITITNLSGTNTGDVTLSGTPNYLTLANQVITLTKLDISDDTNATGGVGIDISANDFVFDATELSTLVWSNGGSTTLQWTINLTGTDPVFDFSPGLLQFTGAVSVSSNFEVGADYLHVSNANKQVGVYNSLFNLSGGSLTKSLLVGNGTDTFNATASGIGVNFPGGSGIYLLDSTNNVEAKYEISNSILQIGTITNNNVIFTSNNTTRLTLANDGTLTAAASIVADFGGATSFEIPNGTGFTFTQIGQIYFDTTDNQFQVASAATNSPRVVRTMVKLWSASIASTSSQFYSGGSYKLPIDRDKYNISEIHCDVTGGTSVVINVSSRAGNYDTETVTCDLDGANDTSIDTNSNYTGFTIASSSLEIGTITGSVNWLNFSIWGLVLPE